MKSRTAKWLPASVAAVAVLAIVGGTSALATTNTSEPDARALADTPSTPQEVARNLETVSSDVLSDHVKPGDGAIVVQDDQFKSVPLGELGEAESISVNYANANHTWQIYLGQSDSSGIQPSPECLQDVVGVLQCKTTTGADGNPLVETTLLSRKLNEASYILISEDEAEGVPLSELRITRDVRSFKADGTVTSVVEEVKNPASTDFLREFDSPTEDLSQIAVDESLQAPER